MGFRTLFYVPVSLFINLKIDSPYRALFARDQDEFLAKLKEMRTMTHASFMQRLLVNFF